MGNLCDWKAIRKIANKYKLLVIEDSADTLGAKLNGKSSGYYSDMSITSFYGSHIINCAGNGGALTLNSKKFLDKAKLLRSWGRSSSLFDEKSEAIENRFNIKLGNIDYDAKFVFETIGYNVEGSEIGAAFGLTQLKSLKKNIQIRKSNFKKQYKFFNKHKSYFTNPEEIENSSTAWLAYPILINKNAPFSRKDFQIYLITLKKYTDNILELAPKALKKMNKENIFNINVQDGTHGDKEYEGEDPKKLMNIAFSYKEKGDWDAAIEYLQKSYDDFAKSD